MKIRHHLIILLVVVVLIAGASLTFAEPKDEPDGSEPVGVNAGYVDEVLEINFEEPLPCTNQRGKALYGCP